MSPSMPPTSTAVVEKSNSPMHADAAATACASCSTLYSSMIPSYLCSASLPNADCVSFPMLLITGTEPDYKAMNILCLIATVPDEPGCPVAAAVSSNSSRRRSSSTSSCERSSALAGPAAGAGAVAVAGGPQWVLLHRSHASCVKYWMRIRHQHALHWAALSTYYVLTVASCSAKAVEGLVATGCQ
jgi:hypothetical protein